MGRGKIEIKRIENPTNRQVTYSKRRAGIMKKAQELTVLCDAEVSLLMISATGKVSEFVSPSTTVKKVYDRFQQVQGSNLWQSHYERMQENLNKQKEINNKLRREIRQRNGDDLNHLTFQELRGLEQNMEKSLKNVRDRKYHVITTSTETYKKKIRHLEETQNTLLREFEGRDLEAHYVLADAGVDYQSALGLANGRSHIFALRLQPNQPNLRDAGGYNSISINSYDLSLA
uniref:MADS transcription factor AP3-2 n=1 Tax=Glaucidium palmatum TaxID=39106 RepID=A0A7L7T7V9_9MAGN|nr:MADS transcription factor AP3-2 [Glaucidium palmatum]